MDVFTAIKGRRSIRNFKDSLIEADKLEKVLEAARLSPSANNMQDWKFIIVGKQKTRDELAKASNQSFISEAPLVIVSCATNPGVNMKCGIEKAVVDLSIATAFMILEAQELGLGSCWIGHFDKDMVRSILDIPKNVSIVAIFPLGYAGMQPQPRSRKSLDEIICYDKYS